MVDREEVEPTEAARRPGRLGRLEAERARVEGLIEEIKTEVGADGAGQGVSELADYDQHPADVGSETFEREKDLSILESLEVELAEITAALERIEKGTYGIDEITGEPIDPERLEAMPAARTNVETERDSRH